MATLPPGPTVVFRCDAGPTYGIGHVMRCVALGEEFAARGARVVFVADLDAVPWARDQVTGRGFAAVAPPPPGAEVRTELDRILGPGPALVVLDSYVLPENLYAGVRAAGIPTLALVDGDPAGRPADLWLDQNIGAESDPWSVPDGTLRLAGTRYALMREEIRALRPATPERTEHEPVRVFAFFGGTDAFGAAPLVTALLAGTGLPWEASVVAATDDLAARCREVALGPGQRLSVIAPTRELAAAVRRADVVLSAAGTSSWELLCLGSATGLLCVADNQETSYGRMVRAGLTAGIGHLAEIASGPGAELTELLSSAPLRGRLRATGWHEVDGRGRERVADACRDRFGVLGD